MYKIIKSLWRKKMFCEEWAKNKFNDDLKEWFPKYKEYEKKGFKIEADTTISGHNNI